MKLLAFDTATDLCSVALWCDGQVTARQAMAPRRHGEFILPMINAILAENGIAVAHLDALAFGRGPGTFTGVRMAASVAQGIAFAIDLPVIPISTLATVAQTAWLNLRSASPLPNKLLDGKQASSWKPTHIAVALDARMDEVYFATYRLQKDTVVLLGNEQVIAPSATTLPDVGMGSEISQHHWVGVGSGFKAYKEALHHLTLTACWEEYPHAVALAQLAVEAYQRGEGVEAALALPVYLRDQVAVAKDNGLFKR